MVANFCFCKCSRRTTPKTSIWATPQWSWHFIALLLPRKMLCVNIGVVRPRTERLCVCMCRCEIVVWVVRINVDSIFISGVQDHVKGPLLRTKFYGIFSYNGPLFFRAIDRSCYSIMQKLFAPHIILDEIYTGTQKIIVRIFIVLGNPSAGVQYTTFSPTRKKAFCSSQS